MSSLTRIKGFVADSTVPDAMVYTDGELATSASLSTKPSGVGEYVQQAHTNGIQLKRGYYGTYHKMSPKHLGYVCGAAQPAPLDTLVQMAVMVRGLEFGCATRISWPESRRIRTEHQHARWNNKGGVGKSFLTFVRLSTLPPIQEVVCVIDMCPQANTWAATAAAQQS